MSQAASPTRASARSASEGEARSARLYREMARIRLVSARMVALQRAGKVAFHASPAGEEAPIAAAALALGPNDALFPGVREWGAALVRGVPIEAYVRQAVGSRGDASKGHASPDHPSARTLNVFPASGIAGAHLPQAVGYAWAARMSKDPRVAVALFGDEIASTGDFHNALNFAGVFKAPVVFVCRAEDSAVRAVAYGLASAKVDGSDTSAVQNIVREAIERAASGKGATLIEAPTKPITSMDDASLASDAVLGDLPRDESFIREVRAEIDAAVAAAEAAGPPATSTIFEDVYAGEKELSS